MRSPGQSPRVLMVAGQFWPVLGGAEQQARLLAAELRRQGVAVEIATRRLERAWPRSDEVDGVPVRRLGPPLRPGMPKRLSRWLFMLELAGDILKRREEIDLVHVHQVLSPAFAASIGARLAGRPCLARVSGSGASSEFAPANRGPLGFQLAITRRLLTRVVATGEVTRRGALEAGFRAAQVVVIPNGVAVPDRVAARSAGLDALWVGRFRPEKRVDLLIEAWRLAGIPGRLKIVGDGPLHDLVETLARDAAGVELIGELPDPGPLFASSNVFVLCSDAEGMSNALLEAMAAGCACVATDVGENRHLLDSGTETPSRGSFARGNAGLLVAAGDAAGLASALAELARDLELRQQLAAAAFRRSRQSFAIDVVARAYLDLYASLGASGR